MPRPWISFSQSSRDSDLAPAGSLKPEAPMRSQKEVVQPSVKITSARRSNSRNRPRSLALSAAAALCRSSHAILAGDVRVSEIGASVGPASTGKTLGTTLRGQRCAQVGPRLAGNPGWPRLAAGWHIGHDTLCYLIYPRSKGVAQSPPRDGAPREEPKCLSCCPIQAALQSRKRRRP